MKITIVQGAFLPVPPVIGGAVEKIWFALGKEFAKQGHQVIHISRRYCKLPDEEIIENVQHIRIPSFDAPKSLLALKILDLIYSLRVLKSLPKSDVLVTNTFWLPVLIRSSRFGALYVHIQRYPKGQFRFYRHAARLQTVSNVIAHALTSQDPISKDKVKIIPNPLTERFSRPDVSCLHKQWILYVGRIHPEKGLDLLIKAFHQLIESGLDNWRLVVVGPWQTEFGGGGEVYYQYLRSESKAEAEYIDWIGPVFDSKELNNYYFQSSLFVYPSLANLGEASPLAPVEAMACGCPPLVSNLDCFKDYIEENRTGFIFDHLSNNPATSLANKIREIINDEKKLNKMRLFCLEASERYSVEKISKLYIDDFNLL